MGRTNFKLMLLIVHWLKGFGIEVMVRSRVHDIITFGNHAISVRDYKSPERVAVYNNWIGADRYVLWVDPEDPNFLGKIAGFLDLGT